MYLDQLTLYITCINNKFKVQSSAELESNKRSPNINMELVVADRRPLSLNAFNSKQHRPCTWISTGLHTETEVQVYTLLTMLLWWRWTAHNDYYTQRTYNITIANRFYRTTISYVNTGGNDRQWSFSKIQQMAIAHKLKMSSVRSQAYNLSSYLKKVCLYYFGYKPQPSCLYYFSKTSSCLSTKFFLLLLHQKGKTELMTPEDQ